MKSNLTSCCVSLHVFSTSRDALCNSTALRWVRVFVEGPVPHLKVGGHGREVGCWRRRCFDWWWDEGSGYPLKTDKDAKSDLRHPRRSNSCPKHLSGATPRTEDVRDRHTRTLLLY